MEIETGFLSLAGALGIGGIIGSYLQNLWSKNREVESKSRDIKEDRYRSVLVWMRCALSPSLSTLHHFNTNDPYIQELKSNDQIKGYAMAKLTEFYYNSVLYAPDDVLQKFNHFMIESSEDTFMDVALAMRKDLWKTSTKINLKELSLK